MCAFHWIAQLIIFLVSILKLSNAIDLKKKASLYLPEHLWKELENNPNIINIIESIV